MTERLADLVIGLQRLAENAVIRGDDLSYVQRQEVYDHVAWLDQQIAVLDKVRATFMEQRKKFVPVERERPALSQQDEPRMPRVVRPKEAQQG